MIWVLVIAACFCSTDAGPCQCKHVDKESYEHKAECEIDRAKISITSTMTADGKARLFSVSEAECKPRKLQ